MSAARVDHHWVDRDLDQYPTAAILGTLAHYGVEITEPGFALRAAFEFPLSIGLRWSAQWKGKGKFKAFPAAAADELWRRARPGEFTPSNVALTVIKLAEELDVKIKGVRDEGLLETRFKIVEKYVEKLPAEAPRLVNFLRELEVLLLSTRGLLENLPVRLIASGFVAESTRLVQALARLRSPSASAR